MTRVLFVWRQFRDYVDQSRIFPALLPSDTFISACDIAWSMLTIVSSFNALCACMSIYCRSMKIAVVRTPLRADIALKIHLSGQ
jgi:hypothetical protein